MPPTKAAAATSNSTECAVDSTLHRKVPAQGGTGKSTKPPNKALAVQTGSVASAAAATRLGVVDTPPPRLTMDQQIAADIADAKAASARRRENRIQRMVASNGWTLDYAKKMDMLSRAKTARARDLAQKKHVDSCILVHPTSPDPDFVWGGNDVGWVPRE